MCFRGVALEEGPKGKGGNLYGCFTKLAILGWFHSYSYTFQNFDFKYESWICYIIEKIDFLSQVLDSLEKDAVKDAVQTLQDIGRFDPWLSSMFVFERQFAFKWYVTTSHHNIVNRQSV